MEEDWERPLYEAGGGDASVLLVVFATAIRGAGGHAVANLPSLGMFTPEQWRGVIFAPDKPQPRLHVNVFHSEEARGAPQGAGSKEDIVWLHSRGLRAFGRPDLS